MKWTAKDWRTLFGLLAILFVVAMAVEGIGHTFG